MLRRSAFFHRTLVGSVLGAALMLGSACTTTTHGHMYVASRPPAPVYETRHVSPGPGYVWIEGYQRWDGRGYSWVPGRWEHAPSAHATWVPGRWEHDRHGWYYVDGHWRH